VIIGLAILGYVAAVLVVGSFVGRHLRKQRDRQTLPVARALTDRRLDISAALKRRS